MKNQNLELATNSQVNNSASKSKTAIVLVKKEMTPALKKVNEYRDKMHSDAIKLMPDDYSCVVYLYENNIGRPCAVGYLGRSKKPVLCGYYGNVELRLEAVNGWIEKHSSKNKPAKIIQPCKLVVGDVLKSSWGYDQTNVDYYLVLEQVSKKTVKLVQIGALFANTDECNIDSGRLIPNVKDIVGKPFIKRVNGESVRIREGVHARKKHKNSTGTFNSDYFSRYH